MEKSAFQISAQIQYYFQFPYRPELMDRLFSNPVYNSLMGVISRGADKYSSWNRTRKLALITKFIVSNNVRSCLLVGANSNAMSKGFVNLIEREVCSLILDLGGEVSVSGIETEGKGWPSWVQADGRDLPFPDKSFDLVLSNAVIEHVGDFEDQLRFINEHERVGRTWILTTPNRIFPVESHTRVLFVHMRRAWSHPSFTRLLSKRDLTKIKPEGSRIIGNIFSPTFICVKAVS